jgi:hypothetical protein
MRTAEPKGGDGLLGLMMILCHGANSLMSAVGTKPLYKRELATKY